MENDVGTAILGVVEKEIGLSNADGELAKKCFEVAVLVKNYEHFLGQLLDPQPSRASLDEFSEHVDELSDGLLAIRQALDAYRVRQAKLRAECDDRWIKAQQEK